MIINCKTLQGAAARPVDGASVAAFRVLLGLLVAVSAVRFLAQGWVDHFFVRPTYFFTFWGFDWVTAGPAWLMTAVVGLTAVCGVGLAIGRYHRAFAAVLFLSFTWLELIDVTRYLNHYYLVSLLSLLMVFLPAGRATVPAWAVWLLRFQVGLVYVYAAVAKMGVDWLVYGQPLGIWLSARTDLPVIGPLLGYHGVAVAFSWAGLLHDLLVVPALLFRRTRPYAYAVVVCFHLLTGLLFSIGMFPFIMIAAATIFFEPDWPRRLIGSAVASVPKTTYRMRPAVVALVAIWCVAHVAIPLRSLVYEGPVVWHEQGMRFSWKVMVREKNGAVTYRVRHPETGREVHVQPARFLTDDQEREMSGQPDLILQLAHHVGATFTERWQAPAEVRADALVSLNGRPMARLIDPEVDLMTVQDGLAPARWILPAPTTEPIRLRPARRTARR